MKLAIVLGQVVSTMKHVGFTQDRLVLVDLVDDKVQRQNNVHVAVDTLGAGVGEVVMVVSGSSARKAFKDDSPIDMSIVGIVDEVTVDHDVVYHK